MKNMKEFYRAKYRGSLFVVKVGGRAITDEASRRSILSNIQDFTANGMKVLLVYGGGHANDEALKAAGIEPRKVEGRRITGPREIEIIKQVMSADLGYKIGSTMAELEMDGLCLGSIPASWGDIALRARDNPEDYGYDGTLPEVFGAPIHQAFEGVSFIATPCLGVNKKNAVNINADNVAVALATGAKARKLIFLSDVDGVLKDGKALPYITDKEIPGLIADGTATDGMKVKLENCLYALNNGVRRIHLLDGFRKDALLSEIYDSEGPATMLIHEEDRQSYLNEVQAEKAIATLY